MKLCRFPVLCFPSIRTILPSWIENKTPTDIQTVERLTLVENILVKKYAQHTNGKLQRFTLGELGVRGSILVSRVIPDVVVVGVVLLHGRWGHIKATTPDLNLYLNKLARNTLRLILLSRLVLKIFSFFEKKSATGIV